MTYHPSPSSLGGNRSPCPSHHRAGREQDEQSSSLLAAAPASGGSTGPWHLHPGPAQWPSAHGSLAWPRLESVCSPLPCGHGDVMGMCGCPCEAGDHARWPRVYAKTFSIHWLKSRTTEHFPMKRTGKSHPKDSCCEVPVARGKLPQCSRGKQRPSACPAEHQGSRGASRGTWGQVGQNEPAALCGRQGDPTVSLQGSRGSEGAGRAGVCGT